MNNRLIYNGYFDIKERNYPFNNVSKIIFIDKFKNKLSGDIESTSTYYVVLMKDGFRWNTLNLTINNTPKETEILNRISQQAGVQIKNGIHNVDDIL